MSWRFWASVAIVAFVLAVARSQDAIPVAIGAGVLTYLSLWAGDVRDARRHRRRQR